ncbi:MAG: phosphoglycerate dehydrogenase [Oscillospiraceae bacterium]|jgi:D-isomer specific 2-hydroxyacid dehydrogenase NAD-binding protein|uniref:phosphoglycerate dehydrogenase n=1 Tax=Candidatus Limivicinus sp. TaxID=3030905 RepID=UPI00306D2821
MQKKILIAKPKYSKFSPTGYRMLLDKGYSIIETGLERDYTLEELKALIGDVDGVIADSEPWCEEAMAAAPKLKVISRYGTGMNTVDTDAAKKRGIVCTNCPGVNANSVAEHILALMLGAVRDIVNLNRDTKEGKWNQYIFHEIAGATVGILGFGFIGQSVAKKLTGFDCTVLACDPMPNYEAAEKTNTRITSFDEIIEKSDIICICVPLVADTYHWINADSLSRTKKGVIFVSDARGPVVDEAAMTEALKKGQVAFFATDVFEHEPATPENTPMMLLPNVIATPHNGGETYENSERCGICTAQQVIDVFEGREPFGRRA